MERLTDECVEVSWRRDPICEPADRDTSSFNLLPIANESNPPGAFESPEHHLREEVKI